MTLLNKSSNGYVSTMVALWRTARVFGEKDGQKLLALCSPRVRPDQSHMGETLSTWRTLGMFSESKGSLELVPPFDTIDPNDIESLRTAVLDLLLRDENAPAFLTEDLSHAGPSHASDFVRVACWTLAQDPYEMSSMNRAAIEAAATEQGVTLYQGDGRWASFQEWVYFTGLGVPTKFGLVICPARAVRAKVREMTSLTDTVEMPLKDFLVQLAKALPVIDGGRYREQIDAVRGANPAATGLGVSPALSLALLQLGHEGEIELSDRPGDVGKRIAFLGRGGEHVSAFSHIRRGRPVFSNAAVPEVQP